MIGAPYWTRTLTGLVGLRVKVRGKGGRDIVGKLGLEREGLTVTTRAGEVLPMVYENIEAVLHPVPGEEWGE
jgi:hypothetical protein